MKEAPEEMLRLEHWGCPWSREPDGHVAVRPFGGMKVQRTWFAADKTGFHMLHTLFQTTLKYEGIRRFDESFVTSLLVDDGRCQGVVAIELATGQIRAITARAVILCTGGCGKIFPFTTNANIKNGDGMALAYRAGAPLKDMEFVQYHPTGLPFTGILITEAARAEGGWLLNKDGYRYLQDYDLGKPEPKPVLRSMELGPRDRLSQAFVKEQEKGRTLEGPYGNYVHLDVRHLGRKTIDPQHVDPVRQRVPVGNRIVAVDGVVNLGRGGVDASLELGGVPSRQRDPKRRRDLLRCAVGQPSPLPRPAASFLGGLDRFDQRGGLRLGLGLRFGGRGLAGLAPFAFVRRPGAVGADHLLVGVVVLAAPSLPLLLLVLLFGFGHGVLVISMTPPGSMISGAK